MHSGQCWSKQLPRNLVQLLYTQCARAGGQAGRGEPSHGMQVSHGKWGFEERSKGGIQCYRNSNSTVQSNRSTVAVACTRGYMLRLHARGYTPALHMPRLHDGGYMHEVTYTRLHAEVTCRGYMLRLHAEVTCWGYIGCMYEVTCRGCMLRLHVEVTCRGYMPRLHAEVTC